MPYEPTEEELVAAELGPGRRPTDRARVPHGRRLPAVRRHRLPRPARHPRGDAAVARRSTSLIVGRASSDDIRRSPSEQGMMHAAPGRPRQGRAGSTTLEEVSRVVA